MRPKLATILIEGALVMVTLLASGWLVSHTDRQLESALGLVSTQWLHDMPPMPGSLSSDRFLPLPTRIQYARTFPWSPIARINKIPGIFPIEMAIAKSAERVAPALAVASVGLGIIAVRSPGPKLRRGRRWGPGRVAAAVGLAISSWSILIEFLLRKFDLMKYGWYHDTLTESWSTNATTVGVATLSAWLLMAASGRWRMIPGWRERLGLILGVLWVVMLAWLVVLSPLAQL